MSRGTKNKADCRADTRGGAWAGIPKVVLASEAYRTLTPFERAVLVAKGGEITRPIPFNPIRREIVAVWDMGNINVNQRSQDPKARNGSWVYLRIP